MTALMGPPRDGTYCSHRRKEGMINNDRRWREGVNAADRAQAGAATGAAGGSGGLMGEAGMPREAPGEGGRRHRRWR